MERIREYESGGERGVHRPVFKENNVVSSDAIKMSIGSLATAIVVLLIFYFLDHAGH
jgi:hypothetical protein